MIGRDLPALAIRRPLLVLVLNLLVALAGLAAALVHGRRRRRPPADGVTAPGFSS